MISERQYGSIGVNETKKHLKFLIAIILITAGIIIALWTITKVYKIFTNPQEIEVFKQIVPDKPEMRELDIAGQKVILPAGIFLFMAYGIGCLLLLVASGIATGLITGGVNLLQSNFQKLETKVITEIENLKVKIDELKETFKKKSDST
ncbi:hypothetical protein KAW18_06180 [candidate division WOR-3 bacterium]|nr:hypothetical protein [candidate division WOR-3 bacterium]